MTFPVLLADLVCPVLGAGVLAAPLLRRPRRAPWREWAQATVTVGWVYLLTFADRCFGWWNAVGLDFSTHLGVALALAISLGRRERRLRLPLALLLLAYAALMIALRYHSAGDIVTSAAVVAPVALLVRPRRGVSACGETP
jgi:hypothetical protein